GVTSDASAPAGQSGQPHVRRLIVIWVVLSVIAVPLVIFVLGPHMPPWTFSSEARDQRNVNILLAALATPALLGIWAALVYSIASFRQRGAAIADGPPIRGGGGLQVAWVAVTAVVVLSLAVLGTLTLFGT